MAENKELVNVMIEAVKSFNVLWMEIEDPSEQVAAEGNNKDCCTRFKQAANELGIECEELKCEELAWYVQFNKKDAVDLVAELTGETVPVDDDKEEEEMIANDQEQVVAENVVENKEEAVMIKKGLTLIVDGVETETTLDELGYDTIVALKELTKDVLRIMLEEENVVLSNSEFKRTKRIELINQLYAIMHPDQVAEEETQETAVTTEEVEVVEDKVEESPMITKLRELGVTFTDDVRNKLTDLDLCGIYNIVDKAVNGSETTTVEEVTEEVIEDQVEVVEDQTAVTVDQTEKVKTEETTKIGADFIPAEVQEEQPKEKIKEAPVKTKRQKMDEMFGLIKDYCADSKRRGFGYAISPFMLTAAIMKADKGVEKLKDYTMTDEDKKMCNDIFKFLKDKGIIRPIVYSVVEDEKVRIYMDGYKGRGYTKTKMIHYSKSKGYTAKQVTSYAVYLDIKQKESTTGSSSVSTDKYKALLNTCEDRYEKVLSGEITDMDDINEIVQKMYDAIKIIKDKNIVEDIELMVADLGLRVIDAA